MQKFVSADFIFDIIKNTDVILSNIPEELMSEVDECTAEAKLLTCKVKQIEKRQKKLPIDDGYVYLCTYDKSVTKNDFKKYFDILLSFVPAFDKAVENAANPSFDIVKKLRHNVYDQLSHILDDMKFVSGIEDITSRDWNDIVEYCQDKILSNAEKAAIAVLRTIKRTSIALSEFDAYEIISSSSEPRLYQHAIHKVTKLSLQPYLLDFWSNNIKITIRECYDKVLIDYELVNLALGHFWNNAVKYAMKDSEIVISFSPAGKQINATITMSSIAIKPEEIEEIFKIGTSGEYAKQAKLSGTGIGMYYIKNCLSKSNCSFIISPGKHIILKDDKRYAENTFKLSFTKA